MIMKANDVISITRKDGYSAYVMIKKIQYPFIAVKFTDGKQDIINPRHHRLKLIESDVDEIEFKLKYG